MDEQERDTRWENVYAEVLEHENNSAWMRFRIELETPTKIHIIMFVEDKISLEQFPPAYGLILDRLVHKMDKEIPRV